jgi:hypothetical protein
VKYAIVLEPPPGRGNPVYWIGRVGGDGPGWTLFTDRDRDARELWDDESEARWRLENLPLVAELKLDEGWRASLAEVGGKRRRRKRRRREGQQEEMLPDRVASQGQHEPEECEPAGVSAAARKALDFVRREYGKLTPYYVLLAALDELNPLNELFDWDGYEQPNWGEPTPRDFSDDLIERAREVIDLAAERQERRQAESRPRRQREESRGSFRKPRRIEEPRQPAPPATRGRPRTVADLVDAVEAMRDAAGDLTQKTNEGTDEGYWAFEIHRELNALCRKTSAYRQALLYQQAKANVEARGL